MFYIVSVVTLPKLAPAGSTVRDLEVRILFSKRGFLGPGNLTANETLGVLVWSGGEISGLRVLISKMFDRRDIHANESGT